MPTKMLTSEQARRLQEFTSPFIQNSECCAEAAIRRIKELEDKVRELEKFSNLRIERFVSSGCDVLHPDINFSSVGIYMKNNPMVEDEPVRVLVFCGKLSYEIPREAFDVHPSTGRVVFSYDPFALFNEAHLTDYKYAEVHYSFWSERIVKEPEYGPIVLNLSY